MSGAHLFMAYAPDGTIGDDDDDDEYSINKRQSC